MPFEAILIELLKRLSFSGILALFLSQTDFFNCTMTNRMSKTDKTLFFLFFSCISIIGTHIGYMQNSSFTSLRIIGVVTAGLLGGPLLGSAVGFMAGLPSFLLGGFTAGGNFISSIVQGLLAGFFNRLYPRMPLPWPMALLVGFIAELTQMLILVLTTKPLENVLELLSNVHLNLLISNALAIMIFILIVELSFSRRQSIIANNSNSVLLIARETLPFWRKGLTIETAEAVVKIIRKYTRYDAVAITNREQLLAHSGAEYEHHTRDTNYKLSDITQKAMQSNTLQMAFNPYEIGCPHPNCTLHSAIVVPLTQGKTVIGALKLYYTYKSYEISAPDRIFASGLAELFSTQIELAEIDAEAKRTEEAKLRALYAQINPHFLFNTLNTITSLIRTNPELARKLLVKFSNMFRFTLQHSGHVISFATEWIQAKSFLDIVKARQGDKLEIYLDIEEGLNQYGIPSLTLQPLVENAISHGLQPKEDGGYIKIHAYTKGSDYIIEVIDNGVGFTGDPTEYLNSEDYEHIGLSNVHQRIRRTYGPKYGLSISANEPEGTTITIRLPKIGGYHD